MTVADPDQARLRVCCTAWRHLYEQLFPHLEDELSHARVRLLAIQHQGQPAETAAAVSRWRAVLEACMPSAAELGTIAAALPAPQILEHAIAASEEGLSGTSAVNDRCWTSPNAESVLVDAGAGTVAYELGIQAQVRRRAMLAESWWRCAAVTHHPRAATELALLMRARGDLAGAHRWWRRAAQDAGAPPLGIAEDVFPAD